MSALIDRLVASRRLPVFAALLTLAIGLIFIFVWAPHPWGWYGIDQYHQIAVELAAGKSFDTFDVPWGYAYFLAPFYRLFGPTPLPALIAQALLNATIPLLVYAYTMRAFDRRVAAVATVLVALLSFNTVYVSTESTDSVSTVLFMAMLLAFVHARVVNRDRWYIVVGVLAGVVAQFRPNLVLLPFAFAGMNWLLGPWRWFRVRQGVAIVVTALVLLVPWTWRNYQLSGQFLPTSSHGGIQLWYGTLQTGPYLESRAHNPRSVFATAPFDYTSLTRVPIDVDVWMNCGPGEPESVKFIYRLDGGPFTTLALTPAPGRRYRGSIPAIGANARVYYYTEVAWAPQLADPPVRVTPKGGAADPLVYFVSDQHTADLDTDDALLDIFDVVRIVRHIAWAEPVRATGRLDTDRDGGIDENDLRAVLRLMLRGMDRGGPSVDRMQDLIVDEREAKLRFVDQTELVVPRQWKGELTDLAIGIGIAENLLSDRYRFTEPPPIKEPFEIQCLGPGEVAINRAYYRVQPHEQQRYVALALDNIRRAPVDYAWSVLYRAVRLFVILGTDDRATAQQFSGSRLVYLAGTVLSLLYLVLALVGVWLGWRRGYQVVLPVLLILYIPATIAFVLTNMRYTTTVQPLLLIFVAVTIVALADRSAARRGGEAG